MVSVWLYGTPFAPFARGQVAAVETHGAENVGASTMLIVTVCVTDVLATDVAVSVPEMADEMPVGAV
jgi:hypothetical protein